MEMNTDKTEKRKLLIIEMVLILSVSIMMLILYILFDDAISRSLSHKVSQILYRQSHIAILVCIFVLFNTTYYSFVSYKSIRMLVLSSVAAGVAGLYVFYFVSSFMRINELTMFSVQSVQLQTTFIAFLFLMGVAISHHYDEGIMLSSNVKGLSLWPFLSGILITVCVVLMLNQLLLIFDSRLINQLIGLLNSLAILGGGIVFALEMYRFIIAQRRYLVRMSTSIALLTVAVTVKQVSTTNFAFSIATYNFFLMLAIISYIYAAFKYNIAMPLLQQRNAERQITLYAENLEKIVQKRTAELRKGTETFLTDIEYAKKIQQSLLPGDYLKFNGAEFTAAYYPCERLSGDFYDIFMIDPDTLGMYVLDVSGHGIPAALMTMFCMNYIKTSERLINQYRAKKPHRNLKHFFDEFNKVNFPEEMHMVMFFASYDMRQRILTYCSGGMNTLPFVIKKDGEVIKLDQSSGFPICRVGNFFSPEYHSAKIELEIGDRVFFYTDGLTDKGANQVFDEEELIALLTALRAEDIKIVRQKLVHELMDIVNRLDDDITFFVMEVI